MPAWCLPILIAAAAPGATGGVRALTIDGKTIEGAWSGIDAQGRLVIAADQDRHTLAPDETMLLAWPDAKPAEPPAEFPTALHLADGSILPIRITGADAKSIVIATPFAPELRIPLAELAAVRYARQEHAEAREAFETALAGRATSEDVLVVVRDGQVTALRGVTESLTPGSAAFRWRNRSVPIDPASAYGIVFARGVQSGERPDALCLLRDGSAYAGRLTGWNPDTVEWRMTADARLRLPIRELREIRFRSDRVVFLGDLDPAEYAFEPFLPGTRWPYRVDRSVANRTMRIGDQTFERGIGVHAQSKLVYDLADSYKQLAAIIGIDEGAGPRGNVVFRVLADGKEAFNSGPVTGRDEPRPILVPIEGAKRVELVVEFGEELDVGDQADWANARLIK